MRRGLLIGVAVAVAVAIAVGGIGLFSSIRSPNAPEAGGPPTQPDSPAGQAATERAFHEGFAKSMRQECLSNAIATAAKLGRSGPDVEAEMRKRCDCAVEVAEPISMADKIAMARDKDKQAAFLAEVVRRCGK